MIEEDSSIPELALSNDDVELITDRLRQKKGNLLTALDQLKQLNIGVLALTFANCSLDDDRNTIVTAASRIAELPREGILDNQPDTEALNDKLIFQIPSPSASAIGQAIANSHLALEGSRAILETSKVAVIDLRAPDDSIKLGIFDLQHKTYTTAKINTSMI